MHNMLCNLMVPRVRNAIDAQESNASRYWFCRPELVALIWCCSSWKCTLLDLGVVVLVYLLWVCCCGLEFGLSLNPPYQFGSVQIHSTLKEQRVFHLFVVKVNHTQQTKRCEKMSKQNLQSPCFLYWVDSFYTIGSYCYLSVDLYRLYFNFFHDIFCQVTTKRWPGHFFLLLIQSLATKYLCSYIL